MVSEKGLPLHTLAMISLFILSKPLIFSAFLGRRKTTWLPDTDQRPPNLRD
jgi:hypothetical protein